MGTTRGYRCHSFRPLLKGMSPSCHIVISPSHLFQGDGSTLVLLLLSCRGDGFRLVSLAIERNSKYHDDAPQPTVRPFC